MKFLVAATAVLYILMQSPVHANADSLSGNDLIGSWVLHYDPDNAPLDFVDFYKDSSVDLRGDDGDHFICSYAVFDNEIEIRCQVRGQEKILKMHAGSKISELVNPDGAVYWKLPDQEGVTYNKSGWNTLVSNDGKFSVLFFGVPSIEQAALTSSAGAGKALHYRSKYAGAMYMVHALTLPEEVGTEASRKQALENYQGSMLQNFKTFAKDTDTLTVDRVEDVTIQGAAAKKVQATIVRAASGKSYNLTGIVFIRKVMMYQLNAIVPKQQDYDKTASEFIASFVALD